MLLSSSYLRARARMVYNCFVGEQVVGVGVYEKGNITGYSRSGRCLQGNGGQGAARKRQSHGRDPANILRIAGELNHSHQPVAEPGLSCAG